MRIRRKSLQASDSFLMALKELQKKIRLNTGNDRSIRQLTEDLVGTKAFDELEKKIINGQFDGLNMDIKLRFDKRRVF